MSKPVTGIQPIILKWARERAGYSLQQIAKAMKKDIRVVQAWETGEDAPTYVQLEKLAYQLYKRPIALFFFQKPPDEPDLERSFRTLPDFEMKSLDPDTHYALRYARSMQLALAELNEGVNPAKRKIFVDVKFEEKSSVDRVADQIRKLLNVDTEQQASWKNIDQALKSWRDKIEEAGVYVFKRSFEQNDISAFCLLDTEFPIIYLNNGNPKTRQVFSLFHELAHVLLHVNCITKQDQDYIRSLPNNERGIEEICNRLASECLVPSVDFRDRIRNISVDENSVSSLAQVYKVSKEVVLRKLMDNGAVDKNYYQLKIAEWSKHKEKSKPGGGDYYKTQATYLGNRYLSLVFSKYRVGQLSIEQVADYFGVKAKSVPGIEQAFSGKATE